MPNSLSHIFNSWVNFLFPRFTTYSAFLAGRTLLNVIVTLHTFLRDFTVQLRHPGRVKRPVTRCAIEKKDEDNSDYNSDAFITIFRCSIRGVEDEIVNTTFCFRDVHVNCIGFRSLFHNLSLVYIQVILFA